MSRRTRCAAALVATALLALGTAACGGDGAGGGADRPNVLFIVTDDMAVSDLAAMPHLEEWLGEGGTTFSRAYVSVSLCCPTRATMLRGQYAHNTGVLSNDGTNGGFPVAHALGLESSTVATWLDEAGYRTALLGKYLNHYPRGAGVTYVPPGWDNWAVAVDAGTAAGFDYTLNEDGRLVRYGDEREDYAATVLVDRAAELAAEAESDGEPFFTWLAVDAPHEPAVPAPEDEGAFADASAPRGPSFDVVDPSMPDWVTSLPPLSDDQLAEIDARHRDRLESLQSLDRELARLADELDEVDQLDDTYVVFTTDNGFHLGHHRLKAGKQTAFEEDISVPMLVAGPGVPEGRTSDAIVGDVDLAPTFAALAEADAPDFVDGRDLRDLWHGESEDSGRGALLLEHWPPLAPGQDPGEGSTSPVPVPTAPGGDDIDFAPLIGDDPVPEAEAEDDDDGEGGDEPPARIGESPTPPEYSGVRTHRYTYVRYVTGEVELYDNEADPHQLRNMAASAPRELLDRLAGLARDLASCETGGCRSLEEADVP